MNQEVKAQWLAALRSGEYKQGKSQLRRKGTDGPDEYCCLGVLCELGVQAGVIPPAVTSDTSSDYVYGGAYTLPSHVIVEWAGLDSSAPTATVPGLGDVGLTELNDGNRTRQRTFPEIADIIEAYL